VLGGILDVAGIDGFLGNLEALYASVDEEANEWRLLAMLWWQTFGGAPVSASDLLALCNDQDLLLEIVGNGSERSQTSRLGRALNRRVEMTLGDYRVVRDRSATRNSTRYKLDSREDTP